MTGIDSALKALESGPREHVAAALIALTAPDRKTLGTQVRRWATHGSGGRVSADRLALAILATASSARQAALFLVPGWGYRNEDSVDDAVRILSARAPTWLPEFVDSILTDAMSRGWRVTRGLVRAKLVPVPDNEEYLRGMVNGVHRFTPNDDRSLLDHLELDPDLIGAPLIAMIEAEGAGRLLSAHDRFQETAHTYLPTHVPSAEKTWRVALSALSREGRVDRTALLDAVLSAPLRDWPMSDLAWYVTFHDALSPTIDEVVARQSTYARLLTVEHGPTVKLAQREIRRVHRDSRFMPDPVIESSRSTVGRSDKATVVAQLRLLMSLNEAHSGLEVVEVMRLALDHPHADIRHMSAEMIAQMGHPIAESAASTNFVAPSPRVESARHPVEPVRSPEELIEVLLGLLEEVDPIEMERAIDGLLRFADAQPQMADLLRARIGAPDAIHYDADPRLAVTALSHAWLSPRSRRGDDDWPIVLGRSVFPAAPANPESFVGAIGRRLTAIAHAVHRGPAPSVALPQFSDGSLTADALSARFTVLRRRDRLIELEAAIALLRVPPGERARVEMPRWLRGARHIAHVLDLRSPQWERAVVEYQRAWEPQRRNVLFRDVAAQGGGALDGILAPSRLSQTHVAESTYGEYEPRFEQTLALGAMLLPHDPDILASHAHPYLIRDLRKDRGACVPIHDALARSQTRNGDPASSALILGTGAKDARARTAAQDALVDLAVGGLLDGTALGRQAVLLLADDIVVGQRVCSALNDVTRASDAMVLPAIDALQQIVTVLPGRRDAGAFMNLAAELCGRAGRVLSLPAEYVTLANGTSSSMVAKAARRLLD